MLSKNRNSAYFIKPVTTEGTLSNYPCAFEFSFTVITFVPDDHYLPPQ